MNKPPAFQFYPADWLSSTKISLMSPAEEGAYIRLLCHAWADPQCSLPNDDETLAALSRLGEGWFNGASTKIRACFKIKGNRLINVRLEIERKKQRDWRKKSQLGGINSAIQRKNKELEGKGGEDLVDTTEKPKGNTSSSVFSLQSSSPSSLKKEKKDKGIFPDGKDSVPLSFENYEKKDSVNEDTSEAVHFFLKQYKKSRGEDHPLLKSVQWQAVTLSMKKFQDDNDLHLDDLKIMVDAYFKKSFQKGCDYRLLHFVSEGILKNLYFEKLY